MAFFDSPKNRAIWERRLSALREEKEERRKNGFAPTDRENQTEDQKDGQFRRRITLRQLEEKELAKEGVRRVKRPGREMRAAKQAEKQQSMERKPMRL